MLDLSKAIEIVRRWLAGRFPNAVIKEFRDNYGRYCLLVVEDSDRIIDRFLVVFQREPFHRFCDFFPEACSDGVRREAITLNWSEIARLSEIEGGAKVIHVLGDGRVVITKLSDWVTKSYCRYPQHEPVKRVCHLPIPDKVASRTVARSTDIPKETPDYYLSIPIARQTIEELARIFLREKPRDEVEAYFVAVKHSNDLPAPVNYTMVSIAFRRYLTESIKSRCIQM